MINQPRRPFVVYYFRFRVRCFATYSTKEKAQARVTKLESQGWIAWMEGPA